MNLSATTLTRALLVGLVCLFAMARVAYAAHQCYQLIGGGCGAGAAMVEVVHDDGHTDVEVCDMQLVAPDESGSSGSLSPVAFAIAAPLSLGFVAAPDYAPPPRVRPGPSPARVAVLKRFGRLRL
jgi:hypothetical protein